MEILDTDGEGGYARIYPSRLAGDTLQGDDVIYYTLNSSDEIDCLILSEATGDTYTYVYVTSAETSSSGTSVSGSYEYYQNGEQYTINGSVIYTTKTGGAALIYEDEELKNIRQLEDITITVWTPSPSPPPRATAAMTLPRMCRSFCGTPTEAAATI